MTGTDFALHVVAAFVGGSLTICAGVILNDRLLARPRRTKLEVDLAAMNKRVRPRRERVEMPVIDLPDPDRQAAMRAEFNEHTKPTVRQAPLARPRGEP